MAKKIEFPRHLYKGDGPIKWNYGLSYSEVYVKNKKEYDAALRQGFIDDFEEALYGKEEDEDDEEDIIVESDKVEKVEEKARPKVIADDF